MPLWSPPDSPADCALQMIGRYKIREAAIQQMTSTPTRTKSVPIGVQY